MTQPDPVDGAPMKIEMSMIVLVKKRNENIEHAPLFGFLSYSSMDADPPKQVEIS